MAVTRTANVIKVTADADTIACPAYIECIKFVAGAGGTAGGSITVSGVKVWDSGLIAASTATYADEVSINLPTSSDTITVNITGAGAAGSAVLIYLAD